MKGDMDKDVLKDVFLHGTTHADMTRFSNDPEDAVSSYDIASIYEYVMKRKKYERRCEMCGSVVEWELFSSGWDNMRTPAEICKRVGTRLMKEAIDMVLLSMRCEYPNDSVALIKVDGLPVLVIMMIYNDDACFRLVRFLRVGLFPRNDSNPYGVWERVTDGRIGTPSYFRP